MSSVDSPNGDEPGTLSWSDLINEAAQRLQTSGHDLAQAEREARFIVEDIAGLTASELHAHIHDPVTVRAVSKFDVLLSRRVQGEPLQYVLGHWPFRNLDLMVDARVLIPRPETEQVVEFALRELDVLQQTITARQGWRHDDRLTVVDLGTGSGAIGLSITQERTFVTAWLTDTCRDALDVAEANTAGLGRAGARVRTAHGTWFEALPTELRGSVHLIVSNPPYVAERFELGPEVRNWEPQSAIWSGQDGLDDIRHLVPTATTWLHSEGSLVIEYSPEQTPTVREIAEEHFDEVLIERDLAGKDRALVARYPKA